MKKLYLLFSVLSAFAGYAQTNCNAGYESPVFPNTISTPPNIIFTISVTAANAGTLTGISFINTGMSTANIKCCVYDDNAGVPGNLIASTSAYQLTNVAGPVTLAVTPVFVLPGTYHVGAVIDANSDVISIDNTSSITLYGLSSPFSSPFPLSGNSFMTTPGNPVNIWMNITCSASGVMENNPADFSANCFPSPATNHLDMRLASASAQSIVIRLYNNEGQLIMERNIIISQGENFETLDLSETEAGIYFIRISDTSGNLLSTRKIIRE